MFDLGQTIRRKRPALTPMIDVVFLLLVFFMLAARFGSDQTLSVSAPSPVASTYTGAPRLIEVDDQNRLFLNGQMMQVDALIPAVMQLMTAPNDVVVLRPKSGTQVQSLVKAMTVLRDNGIDTIALVGHRDAP